MSELNPNNTKECRRIFGDGINIYEGDTLGLDTSKVFGVDAFDIIVGNPPYNKGGIRSPTGKQLLAQQVKKYLPHAVSEQRDVIPNIYSSATVTCDNDNQLILQLLNKTHDFVINDIVRIYDKNNKQYDVKVIDVFDSTSFKLENIQNFVLSENLQVFVYGKFVDNFHVLDKNAIFTVATAALQEVDRQLQAEKLRNDTLEEELSALKTFLQSKFPNEI